MTRRTAENWRKAIENPSPLNAPASYDGQARLHDSVAIHGFVYEGLRTMPTDDPDWEIWGLNSGWWYPRDSEDRFRADRWFEIHPIRVQTETEMAAIRGCPVMIYLTDPPTQDVPNGREYPLDAILGLSRQAPFACTFAYQMALAIHQGFNRIGLYGVELQMGTMRERTVERASVAYWVGFARGRGIEVVMAPASGVAAHPALYGFEYEREKDLVEIYQEECAAVAALFMARRHQRAHLSAWPDTVMLR